MLTTTIHFFEQAIFRLWWVILFILFCYMCYEQGLRIRNLDYAKLHERLVDLKAAKKEALAKQEDLLLQIHSQSDPAWVEVTLMKELGVVPEGQTKVFFTQKE